MDILQSSFVGAYDLRKNLTSLLAKLQKKEEGIVVTQKGKPAAMLLSVRKFLEMKELNEELEDSLKELSYKQYIQSLSSEVEKVRKGKGKPAKKLFKELG